MCNLSGCHLHALSAFGFVRSPRQCGSALRANRAGWRPSASEHPTAAHRSQRHHPSNVRRQLSQIVRQVDVRSAASSPPSVKCSRRRSCEAHWRNMYGRLQISLRVTPSITNQGLRWLSCAVIAAKQRSHRCLPRLLPACGDTQTPSRTLPRTNPRVTRCVPRPEGPSPGSKRSNRVFLERSRHAILAPSDGPAYADLSLRELMVQGGATPSSFVCADADRIQTSGVRLEVLCVADMIRRIS